MSGDYIELANVQRRFASGGRAHQVLSGVSFSMSRGETVALLGRSGSGKSTLLNVISGIDNPDTGVVRIDGTDLTGLPERQRTLYRRCHIGFIYQVFNLIPTLTALENVALVLELNGCSTRRATDRALSMLECVELKDRANDFPDQFSGGEQQRVAIARALVHQPCLVLADEPTGNLDAESGRHVLGLLRELVKEHQMTLLMVTHSLAVADGADRILTLDAGGVAEGTKGDLVW